MPEREIMRRALPARALTTIVVLVAASLTAASATPEDLARARSARELHESGNDAAAAALLEKTDLERIGDPTLFMLLGELYRERGTIRDRLKSQEVLERAAQLYPEHPGVFVELGHTYFARTFYPDAARAYKHALKYDSSPCPALYKLGVSYYEHWKLRVNAYFDDAASARRWLKSALACDSTNVDAAVRYVNVTYALAMKGEAAAACSTFARRFPDAPQFHLLLGTIAWERKQAEEAAVHFARALPMLDDESYAAYSALGRNVLGYDEMDVYDHASPNDQATMGRGFWINDDPDPTTDMNERLIEHMYRTCRADIFFSHARVHVAWTKPQIRGWDTERGEISIKFGWPKSIQASHGGDRWESWSYVMGGNYHRFVFADPFLNGNLQIPPSRSNTLVFARYTNRLSHYLPESTPVGGAMDVFAFRDSGISGSVYLSMQVNADSVLALVDVENLESYIVRTRFFTTGWEAEQTVADTTRAPFMTMVQGSRCRLYDVVQRYDIPFDHYQIATAFEDNTKATNTVLRGQVDATRYAGDRLAVSDIVLERSGEAGSAFERNGIPVRPNPWRMVGHGQRLRAYYEVYNLLAPTGRSHYRVTYTVRNTADESRSMWNRLGRAVVDFMGVLPGDPLVSQSFEREGIGHEENEQIAIDVDVLDEGRYRLIVEVEDLVSGEQAGTTKVFYKMGGPGHVQTSANR